MELGKERSVPSNWMSEVSLSGEVGCSKEVKKARCLEFEDFVSVKAQGLIHTGRGTRCAMRCKQMGPVDVNGHTARKQHQRKNVRICARVASRVLCGLGPNLLEKVGTLFIDFCQGGLTHVFGSATRNGTNTLKRSWIRY